jgi:hypothetical protein
VILELVPVERMDAEAQALHDDKAEDHDKRCPRREAAGPET